MTVKELIEELQKIENQELPVYAVSENSPNYKEVLFILPGSILTDETACLDECIYLVS